MKRVVLNCSVIAVLAILTAFKSYNQDYDKNKARQLPTEAEWEEAAHSVKLDTTVKKRLVIRGGTWKDVERAILEGKSNTRSDMEREEPTCKENAVDSIGKRRLPIEAKTWEDVERVIRDKE